MNQIDFEEVTAAGCGLAFGLTIMVVAAFVLWLLLRVIA